MRYTMGRFCMFYNLYEEHELDLAKTIDKIFSEKRDSKLSELLFVENMLLIIIDMIESASIGLGEVDTVAFGRSEGFAWFLGYSLHF